MPTTPLPEVTIDLQDNRLGVAVPSIDGAHIKIGVSSLGTVGQIITINSAEDVKTKLGVGPLAEDCAASVALGAKPVYALPAASSAGATTPAVATAPSTGTGTGTLNITGAPFDAYDILVEITRAAANLAANTARFKVSFDGGETYSVEFAMPISGNFTGLLADTGLTFVFVDGVSGTSFALGSKYTATTTAPAMTVAHATAALDLALASNKKIEMIDLVAPANSAMTAVLKAKIAEAHAAFRFIWGHTRTRVPNTGETIDAWKTSLETEFATTEFKFGGVTAAYAKTISQRTGRLVKSNPAGAILGWVLSGALSQSGGEVDRGAIPQIFELLHDENKSPSLDAARFTTLRTYAEFEGIYLTNARSMAAAGSDYTYLESVRVIMKMARVGRVAAMRFMQSRVRVDKNTGKLNPLEVERIRGHVESPLDQMVRDGDLSAPFVELDPDQDVLGTGTIYVDLSGVPIGILRRIGLRIGFRNPRFA